MTTDDEQADDHAMGVGDRSTSCASRTPGGASASAHPEKERVRVFLQAVQEHASGQSREIEAGLSRVAAVERDLATTRQMLEERTRELERVRAQYDSELRNRGERSEDLTAELLREKLAVTLGELRAQLLAQHEARVRELEGTIADKTAMNAQLDAIAKALGQELQEVKTAAASDKESFHQQLASEVDTFTAEIKRTRAQVTAQFMERIDQLEATIAEKDQLFIRANEMVASLQAEADRVRAAGEAALTAKDEAHARERAQIENEKQRLEDKIALQAKQLKELERVVACSEDLQHVRTLEREGEELRRQSEAQDQQTKKLLETLAVLRDICAKSTAVRSILAGTRKNVDLDALFAILDTTPAPR